MCCKICFNGGWAWEKCVGNVRVPYSAAMSFTSGKVKSEMVSGYFLFSMFSVTYGMWMNVAGSPCDWSSDLRHGDLEGGH